MYKIKVKLTNIIRFLFFIFVINSAFSSEDKIAITEFMASNHNTIEDGYGKSSDWIEIYNYGSVLINLSGWFLTDTLSIPDKFSFPSGTLIQPNEFLIIFASGNKTANKMDKKNFIHANFKLSRNGGYLALIKPDKKTVVYDYSPTYPIQFSDVSYGSSMLTTSQNTTLGKIKGYFLKPTPGKVNHDSSISKMGPIITQVKHKPKTLNHGETLLVTTKIQKSEHTFIHVILNYKFMYEPNRMTTMLDNGIHPDDKANDGIFSALIDTRLVKPGHMVRYYVTANHNIPHIAPSRSPAYLKSKDAPEFYGTIVKPLDNETKKMPTLHWFIKNEKTIDQAINSNQRKGFRASIYYNEQFYDNIFNRVRGASGPSFSKKSYKFDFNPGHKFQFLPKQAAVEEINLNSNYQDKAKVREPLAYETYRKSGVIAPNSFQVRVQRNGKFFSIANLTEQIDETFLINRSLDPNGALYKMYNSGTSSTSGVRKQTRKFESNHDLSQLVTGLKKKGEYRENFIFDNLDIPQIINYWAAGTIIQDFDRTSKNWYLYRNTNSTGEWMMIPWDKDLTFGLMSLQTDNIRGNHDSPSSGTSKVGHPFFGIYEDCCSGANSDSGNKVIKALIETPRGKEMFLRRLRSLMDEILQAPGTRKNKLFYESRLDERYEAMRATAELDLIKWHWGFGNKQTLKQAINILSRRYLNERRIHLYRTHNVNNIKTRKNALIPDSQDKNLNLVITPADLDNLSFSTAEEYIKIDNFNSYAVDVSNFKVSGLIQYTFKPGTVIPSKSNLYLVKNINAFRLRKRSPSGDEGLFIQGNYEGQLYSTRDGSINITDATGFKIADYKHNPKLTEQQKYLRVTELHYHPQINTNDNELSEFKNKNDFEFIELKNIGQGDISLNGVKFVDGINYTFPPLILRPGATTLITSNIKAFKSRYGTDLNVAGVYSGKLNNTGETLKLIDFMGNLILSFAYKDSWYSATDGNGYSLVVRSEMSDWRTWNHASNWAISNQINGSPGKSNAGYNEEYEGWIKLYNDTKGENNTNISVIGADPDKDGIATIIEYALGLNPTHPDSDKSIAYTETVEKQDNIFLTYKMVVASNRIDLNYRGQISQDLINWIETPITLSKLDDYYTEISLKDPLPIGQLSSRYFRLQIIKIKF
tara:strand:- start:27 stop:3479 length:3453 start_codon:yes stop_codon:yes gene_type:complete